MMRGPDNFENFVKIQIFLQFTLRSVKVIIVFFFLIYFFFFVFYRQKFTSKVKMLIPTRLSIVS